MSPRDTANEKADANISLHAIEAHEGNEPVQSTRNLQELLFRSCKATACISWNSKLKIEMSTVMLSKCRGHMSTERQKEVTVRELQNGNEHGVVTLRKIVWQDWQHWSGWMLQESQLLFSAKHLRNLAAIFMSSPAVCWI